MKEVKNAENDVKEIENMLKKDENVEKNKLTENEVNLEKEVDKK